MDNEKIILLFWERKETAISVTREQYGRLIRSIAMNVLGNEEDAEECENDTYQALWSTIPPNKPDSYTAYLSRVAKNIALNKARDLHRKKRSAEEVAIHELEEVLSGSLLEEQVDARELGRAIDDFLSGCSQRDRVIFVCRYYYGDSVRELAAIYGVSQNTISLSLHRTKKALAKHLKTEGFL